MVRLKLESIVAILFFIPSAEATVLVNQPSPYQQYEINDTSIVLDYAGNSTGTLTTGSLSTSQGYKLINTSTNTSSDRIIVDVFSNTTFVVPAGKLIGVTLTNNTTNQLVELAGASEAFSTNNPTDCGSGNCFDDKKAAIYTNGQILRLSFNLNKLCPTGSGSGFCSNIATLNNDRLIETIKVNFGVVDNAILSTNVALASGTGNADSGNFTLGISDVPPSVTSTTCSTGFYFPGDGEIQFNSSSFGATTGTGASNAGADVIQYLVMANEAGVTAGASGVSVNSIVETVDFGTATSRIEGFTNTTNGTDHEYDLIVHAQNRSGIISDLTASATGATCKVQSQEIQGILKESKCFIATAAYQDGRASPVMMLRRFRDQILSKFAFGRAFIQRYYQYSPALAEWAWNKPLIRSIALKALLPVEAAAWMILKVSGAEETTKEDTVKEDAVDPYIQRVKKKLNHGQPEVGVEESYTETEKKKLLQEYPEGPKSQESYINRLKQQIEKNEGPLDEGSDYSGKEKLKLPEKTERESPIQMVKEGRDDKLGFGEIENIKNAMSFKLGVSQGMEVAVENGSNSFSEVYGSGFRPELIFHYERQWFHSENFGSLSLGGDFGIAYSGGKGVLQFGVGGNNESRTGFGFFQIPLIADVTYRFNLLRLIRPYGGVGAGTILYNEFREDSKTDKKGYTAVYKMNLGASLLLDFFDSKTHRDSFLTNGFQHAYFFLEYLYLNSFKSNVTFKRSGLYAGFLFEY